MKIGYYFTIILVQTLVFSSLFKHCSVIVLKNLVTKYRSFIGHKARSMK